MDDLRKLTAPEFPYDWEAFLMNQYQQDQKNEKAGIKPKVMNFPFQSMITIWIKEEKKKKADDEEEEKPDKKKEKEKEKEEEEV